MSLKHNIVFTNFLEILLENNVNSSTTNKFVDKVKIILKLFELTFSYFSLKAPYVKFFLQIYFMNSTRVGFRWLPKSIKITKIDN